LDRFKQDLAKIVFHKNNENLHFNIGSIEAEKIKENKIYHKNAKKVKAARSKNHF
jgi:phosphotransferase system IIB component